MALVYLADTINELKLGARPALQLMLQLRAACSAAVAGACVACCAAAARAARCPLQRSSGLEGGVLARHLSGRAPATSSSCRPSSLSRRQRHVCRHLRQHRLQPAYQRGRAAGAERAEHGRQQRRPDRLCARLRAHHPGHHLRAGALLGLPRRALCGCGRRPAASACAVLLPPLGGGALAAPEPPRPSCRRAACFAPAAPPRAPCRRLSAASPSTTATATTAARWPSSPTCPSRSGGQRLRLEPDAAPALRPGPHLHCRWRCSRLGLSSPQSRALAALTSAAAAAAAAAVAYRRSTPPA
jgi:hypothetical protein